MSFWNLEDNTSAAETGGKFESGGGSMEPIPDGTAVLAAIEEAKWDSHEDLHYISLKWRVLTGQYEKRVIFQKVKVNGDSQAKDPAMTKDKAKRMLAAIDTNAGGKLIASGEEPTDAALMSALVGKPMFIKVFVWEMNDKKGNWIGAVAPKKGAQPIEQAPAPTPAPSADFGDDDIPF